MPLYYEIDYTVGKLNNVLKRMWRMDKSNYGECTGIIPLQKPSGWTSHDCVAYVRKLLKTKKVGHTGTLDPEATGVLPLCVGRATKVAEYITNAGKEYLGDVELGISTTTGDRVGAIISKQNITAPISRSHVLEVLKRLTGEIRQKPPLYSAIKVNGKKLYDYARQGETVEVPIRSVFIKELALMSEATFFDHNNPNLTIKVVCSKGTYIRSLAVTIGELLGYPAHLSRLVRTKVGSYHLENTVTIAKLTELASQGQVEAIMQPLETALLELPQLIVSRSLAERIKHGSVFTLGNELPSLPVPTVLLSMNGQALALYQNHPEKKDRVKPLKIL